MANQRKAVFMPEILDKAQIELDRCEERLDENNQITAHTCASVGMDAEAAVRTLQMKMVNASPGQKAKADNIADELTELVDYLVSEGPLNSKSTGANQDNIVSLRRLVGNAQELAMEFRDEDFDLEELKNRTTMSERYEAIGRAAYRHPDLMEGPLNELFQREPSLEPPAGRVSWD